MATQVKEVVVRADAVNAEDVLPYLGKCLFRWGFGRPKLGGQLWAFMDRTGAAGKREGICCERCLACQPRLEIAG